NTIPENGKRSEFPWHASDIPVVRGQRWSAGLPCIGNDLRKLHRIHAAPGERLMLILHEPNAVSRIQHIVDGDHRPSSPVTRLRLLAIPKLRLGNVSARLHESILIEQHLLQTALAHEKLHLRERLVPV